MNTLADRLFMETLLVSAILMAILIANNIFLYKQKIKDSISLMLIFGIAKCVFEILWTVFDKNSKVPNVLKYTSAGGYCVAFLILAVYLNRYLIERFGIKMKKIWIVICYAIPVAVFALISITTPWTGLLFWVNEDGVIKSRVLFESLFQGMVYFYIFSPLLIAVYFLTLGKKKRPAGGEIPSSVFVFAAIAPIIYWIQIMILGEGADAYIETSLPISLALVYLVTNLSTHAVLDTKAHIEAVETDLRIASKIQADALPPAAPEFDDFPDIILRGSMNTAKEVGGDFYDYFPIDENRICFLIADVSGKGTPAALFMMTTKTMIKDYAMTKDTTSEIFTAVNARLCENNDEGMFATAWIGILDTRTMTLQYTNAGHNYPIIQRKGQLSEQIVKVHGLFLGGMEYTRYKQDEITLGTGDRLLLYTDGVTEAHDRENALYGTDRLERLLESTRDEPGEKVLEDILADISLFANGTAQFDDITMVVLTIK